MCFRSGFVRLARACMPAPEQRLFGAAAGFGKNEACDAIMPVCWLRLAAGLRARRGSTGRRCRIMMPVLHATALSYALLRYWLWRSPSAPSPLSSAGTHVMAALPDCCAICLSTASAGAGLLLLLLIASHSYCTVLLSLNPLATSPVRSRKSELERPACLPAC